MTSVAGVAGATLARMRSRPVSRRDVLRAIGLGVPATALFGCNPAEPARDHAIAAPIRAREVTLRLDALATSDGAGVKLHRSIGQRALPMLDPFLLLDEIHSPNPADFIAGFPRHPHRGFETVTYMLEGAMEHRDSLGNHGHLGPGSAQWMTAGHGIIHAEMPKQEGGALWGLQLWVNLPRSHKLIAPRYQDIAPERIVEVASGEAYVRVVAGELGGRRGPVDGIVTAPVMLDVRVPAGGGFSQPLPPSHNAFVYVLEGAVELGTARTRVGATQIAVLGAGDAVAMRSTEGGRALLLAGSPIGEPVARSGPFVMNTDDELQQAWDDYRSGRLVEL